ncbi:MoxR family ATPase [Streptomyces boluensis]|uniref:AAA domain-containing protein n=1 Tax=Streptomyces boluensis TaxID=1775135 RepID=A0A964XQB1_9ACTN|nr:MoxR family ATPase [Streptomyces boluensis]NBE55642.1 AAA domain-containing protein [Streptomyces boluensis]
MSKAPVYTGTGEPHDGVDALPAPPPWRAFDGGGDRPLDPPAEDPAGAPDRTHRAVTYRPTEQAVQLVNAALYLRRPLLVTGPPGSGKSSLAYAVARELRLGPVLRWNITSRSVLADGLYQYDPLSRLYAAARVQAGQDLPSGGELQDHLRLGPLGTSLLPYRRPRVLLIDEIDKSDLDLPNDLLNVLEEGQYEIPELRRAARSTPEAQVMVDGGDERVAVTAGRVRCHAFPFVVLTSNGEREFPPAFLRRCVRLQLRQPEEEQLEAIVRAHLGEPDAYARTLIARFLERGNSGELATDQLLNAIYLTGTSGLTADSRDELAEQLMPYLSHHEDHGGAEEPDTF